MKKVGIITLLFIYSFSVLGFSFKKSYCCGKLKSFTFSVYQTTEQNRTSADGCCNAQFHSFKVKDHHVAAGEFSTPENSNLEFIPIDAYYQSGLKSLSIVDISRSHDPPDRQYRPAYILNCVFRI